MTNNTVFLVSADPVVRDSLAELVASAGMRPAALASLDALAKTLGPEPGGCAIVDTEARDLADPDRIRLFASMCATLPVLALTPRGDVAMAVDAMKQGATDVLQKPCGQEKLLERIRRAIGERRNTTETASS